MMENEGQEVDEDGLLVLQKLYLDLSQGQSQTMLGESQSTTEEVTSAPTGQEVQTDRSKRVRTGRGGRGRKKRGGNSGNVDQTSISQLQHAKPRNTGLPLSGRIPVPAAANRGRNNEIMQGPIFCSGKGKVLNMNPSTIQQMAKMKVSNNKNKIRNAESHSMETVILKQHRRDMMDLVAKINKIKNSGEFDDRNDRQVGTIAALEAQLEEMGDQMQIFNQLKQRSSSPENGMETSNKCLQREIYRFKNRLPALAKRGVIEHHLDNFPDRSGRFLIIQGETGSGKSTQIPQYLADHPKFKNKRIVCTQPRKIAAISLAQRVSFEYSAGDGRARPGRQIGYQVGGQKVKGSRIEFVTEGVMLDRIMSGSEKPFSDVGCIVIDEAHERSIICDILLGSFKKRDPRWEHCLIVVTSATIDLQEFSSFYENAPTVEMKGRTFPIDTYYHPLSDSMSDLPSIRKEVVRTALDIHFSAGHMRGDILCFLPGQEDVLSAKEDFERELDKFANKNNSSRDPFLLAQVFALFGRQDPESQQQVFEQLPANTRKIIFATDVAETSVTIDGVVFVVDSGVRKEMLFDPKRNISTLKLTTISKSSAVQRAGRSGRTQPGECYRLYSESNYFEMSPSSPPEIFRKPLSLAVLSLIEMNIVPQNFEWISAPSKEALAAAEEELLYLGAINEINDEQRTTTALGKTISQSQQEPKLVRMIYRACQEGLGMAAVIIASIFTVSNIFFYAGRDDAEKQKSKEARNGFSLEGGDVVSMYRAFQTYIKILEGTEEQGENSDDLGKDGDCGRPCQRQDDRQDRSKKAGNWCRKNHINGKAIGLIISAKKELLQLFRPTNIWKEHLVQSQEPSDDDLRRLVFYGYFLHTARSIQSRRSRVPQYFAIHPSVHGSLDFKSAIAHHFTKQKDDLPASSTPQPPPEWIVFEKILRLKATTLFPTSTPIDFSWIENESPRFFARCLIAQEELPTEKVLLQTSQECLRKLFGRYFIHMNSMEEELACDLDVDIDNGILAAYCTSADKSRLETTLKNKIEEIVQVLGSQVEEAEYLGGTRVVVGSGYEVKEILFPQEFNTIFIRTLHPSVSRTDLNLHFKRLGISPNVIRSLDLNSYETCQTAVIKFISKTEAKNTLEVLQKYQFMDKPLEVTRAGLGPKKGVAQEEVCRLKLSWSLGVSEKKANICFHTAADANSFIDRVGFLFTGARVSVVHGQVNGKLGRNQKHVPSKAQPPSMVVRGVPLGTCRYRFVVGLDQDIVDFDYKVTVVELPLEIDEYEILRRIRPIVPKWAKVNRKMDSESESTFSNETQKAELAKKLAPLQEYISLSAYQQFHLDKNLVRGILYITFDDKIALEKACKMDYGSAVGGDSFGQPYRLEIEYNHTVSVHSELYPFIQDDILEVKDLAYKKGAMVWDSGHKPSNNNNKKNAGNFKKPKFIFIKFRSCNPNLIRQLQQKLENLASYSKFNDDKLYYLFTHMGKAVLDKIGKTTFLYTDARNCCLYIYGTQEVQDNAKQKLRSEIEKLSFIQVLDRSLMISKKKLNLGGGKGDRDGNSGHVARIERMANAAGIDYLHISGNRILVSGSEEAFTKLKTALTKDNLLFEKQPSHLSKYKGRPDCTVCMMPPDSDFVRSSLCPHAFCVDCIQPMFDMMPPPFPAKCHGQDCGMMMGIGDITKVAKKESLKKVLELAVGKYHKDHPTEIFPCPKPGCGQVLCANNKTTGEYGGEFYFCDECVTTYCIPCSVKGDKPIRSHEFGSCEDARNGLSDEVHARIKVIQETIFNLCCPRCKAAFLDFNGCAAVHCGSCRCNFCGLCLEDCGMDAHPHVMRCRKNPMNPPDLFINDHALNNVHREMRIEKLNEYLRGIREEGKPQMVESIVRAIRRDLIDLGIAESQIVKG